MTIKAIDCICAINLTDLSNFEIYFSEYFF